MLLQCMEIKLFYESICVHFPFTMTREFGLTGEGGGVVSSSAEALVCTVFTYANLLQKSETRMTASVLKQDPNIYI